MNIHDCKQGPPDWKNNSDQTCTCLRDWRLSVSWQPNWGPALWNPSHHHCTSRGSKGGHNRGLTLRDAVSTPDSRCQLSRTRSYGFIILEIHNWLLFWRTRIYAHQLLIYFIYLQLFYMILMLSLSYLKLFYMIKLTTRIVSY